MANMEIQGSPCVLVNCYAPNTETGQIKTFQDLANDFSDLVLIQNPAVYFVGTGTLFLIQHWILWG